MLVGCDHITHRDRGHSVHGFARAPVNGRVARLTHWPWVGAAVAKPRTLVRPRATVVAPRAIANGRLKSQLIEALHPRISSQRLLEAMRGCIFTSNASRGLGVGWGGIASRGREPPGPVEVPQGPWGVILFSAKNYALDPVKSIEGESVVKKPRRMRPSPFFLKNKKLGTRKLLQKIFKIRNV